MNKPIVIGKGSMNSQPYPGGGIVTKIIYPGTVHSVNLFVGLAETKPGASPHRWHKHTQDTDSSGEYNIVYPEEFEEFYYVLSGKGTVQWKTADGVVHEEPVGKGDTIYFPRGTLEHQLLNTGQTKFTVLYGGTPPAQWIRKS